MQLIRILTAQTGPMAVFCLESFLVAKLQLEKSETGQVKLQLVMIQAGLYQAVMKVKYLTMMELVMIHLQVMAYVIGYVVVMIYSMMVHFVVIEMKYPKNVPLMMPLMMEQVNLILLAVCFQGEEIRTLV